MVRLWVILLVSSVYIIKVHSSDEDNQKSLDEAIADGVDQNNPITQQRSHRIRRNDKPDDHNEHKKDEHKKNEHKKGEETCYDVYTKHLAKGTDKPGEFTRTRELWRKLRGDLVYDNSTTTEWTLGEDWVNSKK
uniref:Uncharacterized protein n=1 Tax=Cacopsylla melanoneura TaxID=428564 RepID=A0A8D8WGM9_9HEMI